MTGNHSLAIKSPLLLTLSVALLASAGMLVKTSVQAQAAPSKSYTSLTAANRGPQPGQSAIKAAPSPRSPAQSQSPSTSLAPSQSVYQSIHPAFSPSSQPYIQPAAPPQAVATPRPAVVAPQQSMTTPRPAVAAPAARATTTEANLVGLLDDQGNTITPSAVLIAGNDLYALTPEAIWHAQDVAASMSHMARIVLEKIEPPKKIDGVFFQEFSNFINCPARKSIVVLDKSGDLFEYWPSADKWHLFRANLPFINGQPDPEFIDLGVLGTQLVLLDPERNQIWRTRGHSAKMDGYFINSSTPWVIRKGAPYVGDGLSIAVDGDVFVLKKYGVLSKYNAVTGKSELMRYSRLAHERPSRLVTAHGTPLFIVERENNRVISVDKITGQTNQFIFPAGSDLRGLIPMPNGFWMINGSNLQFRKLAHPDSLKVPPHWHFPDERLKGFVIPIAGDQLPRHVGVFPGARRLYRFGIHEGLDLFNDGASKTRVQMGTPARAALAGTILRADGNFHDMTLAQFNRVMTECFNEHRTSAHNEDLLRGCQVWLSHGKGLVTRYAHLDRIVPGLKKDQPIPRGQTIGFVGVSGTGQNLPGRAKYPHLHFEIWLDGKYVGWGLTPAETMGVYEDVFGNGSE